MYSPRLWPAQAAGKSPRRSTASRTTRLITKVASWALAVGVSSSIGGLEQQGGQVAPGDLGGLGRHFPGGVVDPGLAHPRPLRSLSREGKGQHLPTPLESVSGRRCPEPVKCGTEVPAPMVLLGRAGDADRPGVTGIRSARQI